MKQYQIFIFSFPCTSVGMPSRRASVIFFTKRDIFNFLNLMADLKIWINLIHRIKNELDS